MEYRIGDKTEPCGTPAKIFRGDERVALIFILFATYELIFLTFFKGKNVTILYSQTFIKNKQTKL